MRFVIHALDKPDSVELRMSIRPRHLEYMAGFATVVGGPVLDEQGEPCGSLIILEADSIEDARQFAANDPYYLGGLFQTVSVHEFMTVKWPTES